MTARIYRPSPNAMQSGTARFRNWVLEHEQVAPREIEPLMGYTASSDTRAQVRLTFDTLEEAEAYAQRHGIPYIVQPAHERVVQRSVYPDNFRHDRKIPWTH